MGAARGAAAARRSRTPQYRDLPGGLSIVILLALVAGSIVWRGLQARLVASPWIMPDELIYSSLARSVASSGELAIRGARSSGYSVLYPLLQSLPFSASTSHAAYAAAKWENAVLMSLAAIPVYLLARRLVPNALALLASALTLLMPSMAYTGLLMTENAFFPLFLLAIVAIVRMLEHPTAARQLSALGVIVLAYLGTCGGDRPRRSPGARRGGVLVRRGEPAA